MGRRSALAALPREVTQELNRRLEGSGFSDYSGLEEWLEGQGYEVSRSAIHRYGQQFQKRLDGIRASTEIAQFMGAEVGDDAGLVNDALVRLVQEKFFTLLMQEEVPAKALPSIGRTVAELVKASVVQKKWLVELREKATAAAEEVVAIAKAQGLSPTAADEIRQKILGIAS